VPNRGFPFETHSFVIQGRERRSKWYPFVPWIRPLHRRISRALVTADCLEPGVYLGVPARLARSSDPGAEPVS
jgi:hypothetical protein